MDCAGAVAGGRGRLPLTAFVVCLLLDTEVPARPAGRRHRLGPLTSAPLRRLLIADGLFVLAVTATDVLLPVYAKEHDAAVFTGACPSALSIGSVLGSLVLGTMPGFLARGPKLSVLLLVFAAGGGALALGAGLSPVAVLVLGPVAGLVLGSVFGTLRTVGSDLAQEGEVTGTMSWLTSLDVAGGAVGATVFAHLAAAEGSRTALAWVPAVVLLSAPAGWTARSPSPKQSGKSRRGAGLSRRPQPEPLRHLVREVGGRPAAVHGDDRVPVGGRLTADLRVPQLVPGQPLGQRGFRGPAAPADQGAHRDAAPGAQCGQAELRGGEQEDRLVGAGEQGRDLARQVAEPVHQDGPVGGHREQVLDLEGKGFGNHALREPARLVGVAAVPQGAGRLVAGGVEVRVLPG
ncbi:MFS transporter [Streptomyces rimosus]|uniref:MFS transporter n=1 Tax=Streptomyces rimosus TaxID=1927 RepID=UPI0006B26281|nr:MFS transporter [Streptomyces rimosus]